MEDRRKAHARPPRVSPPDSLDLWIAVLRDLGKDLKLSHAGLFVRYYSRDVDAALFSASRRQVSRNTRPQDALGSLQDDEVTIFPLASR